MHIVMQYSTLVKKSTTTVFRCYSSWTLMSDPAKTFKMRLTPNPTSTEMKQRVVLNEPSDFFEEDATGEYFVLSQSFLRATRDFLRQNKVDENTTGLAVEILGDVNYKKENDLLTWDNVVEEINSQYQQIIR